jgi:hypothetical protein
MFIVKLDLARNLLQEKAILGKTMTYRQFASEIGIVTAPVIATCVKILEELMKQDARAQRPMLAALVVQQGEAGIPRLGFYQLLKELQLFFGEMQGEDAVCWHKMEINKLKMYYHEN